MSEKREERTLDFGPCRAVIDGLLAEKGDSPFSRSELILLNELEDLQVIIVLQDKKIKELEAKLELAQLVRD